MGHGLSEVGNAHRKGQCFNWRELEEPVFPKVPQWMPTVNVLLSYISQSKNSYLGLSVSSWIIMCTHNWRAPEPAKYSTCQARASPNDESAHRGSSFLS